MNEMNVNKSFPISSITTPIIIRNKIDDWKIVKYTEKEWSEVFHDRDLNFRQGSNEYKKSPYWERLCEDKVLTINDFFEKSANEEFTKSNWLYYDYKYMKDVFESSPDFLKEVKWTNLGFPSISGKDSTIWIGSKGAHTPCHQDSYGCNVVAQLYGCKLWILIPPEEYDSLKPVRVPYEESSIYSSINFYTPNDQLLGLKNAHRVILNPGEVLFVPRHWWHYVENLSTAISVNAWIPLEIDHESRLEEALVRNYVYNICQDFSEEDTDLLKDLINPNEYNLVTEPLHHETLTAVIENCKAYREEIKRKSKLETNDLKDTKEFVEVENFDPEQIKKYIERKANFHKYDSSVTNQKSGESINRAGMIKLMINSFCNPNNITSVKETLLKNYEESIT